LAAHYSRSSAAAPNRVLSATLVAPHTLWKAEEVGTTDTAKKAIKELFDGVEVFDTPKPVELLQRIIQISTDKSAGDIILDFFEGAGPIGEAVCQQNSIRSRQRS
jgi:adenine specific DNA methylase Mod